MFRNGYGFLAAPALPLLIAMAAWVSPWAAWPVLVAFMVTLALVEWRAPNWKAAPSTEPRPWHRAVLHVHVLLQAGLLALGVAIAARLDPGAWGLAAAVALGLGVGGVTGAQGITFAHELGHSRSRLDRFFAWCLMSSVLYAHFMIEHYRGHHRRAATHADPATARLGESLWRFLPRTLGGSFASAWRGQAEERRQRNASWLGAPLLWATMVQLGGLVALTQLFGVAALLFWLAQAAQAIFLLETINYIEHYGLQRGRRGNRIEPFGVDHAWNADHALTNAFIANLQRHSDHHMHAHKPYPSLEPLPGPQLPLGYSGCLMLAWFPRLWFDTMHPRLQAHITRAALQTAP